MIRIKTRDTETERRSNILCCRHQLQKCGESPGPGRQQPAAGLCKMFANYCGCVVAGIKEAAVSTILSCSSGHQQPRHSHVSPVSTSSIHLLHRNNCKYLNIVIYSSTYTMIIMIPVIIGMDIESRTC